MLCVNFNMLTQTNKYIAPTGLCGLLAKSSFYYYATPNGAEYIAVHG